MYFAWPKGARSSRNGRIQRASFPEKNRVSTRAGKHDWPLVLIPGGLYRASGKEANGQPWAPCPDAGTAQSLSVKILLVSQPCWRFSRGREAPSGEQNSGPSPLGVRGGTPPRHQIPGHMLHEVFLPLWRQFPRSSLVTGDPAMPRSPASTGSRHFPDGSCIVPWPARPSARRYSASLAGAPPSLLSRNPAVAQILQRLSSALRRRPLRAPHPWRTGIAAGNLLVPLSSVPQFPPPPHRAAAALHPRNAALLR